MKQLARWTLAGLVVLGGLKLFLDVVGEGPDPESAPFDVWYGNWSAMLAVTGVFILFVLGFVRPRRWREWRRAGLYTAFLISLFTEMFGIPLTIYLLAPFLGLPPRVFGTHESHLWAFTLDRLGILPLRKGVYVVMVVSLGLIVLGVGLVAIGWATVFGGQGGLVSYGIYRYLRHPQYLGLILVVLAFNIQWPTLFTLLMAPILVVMYVRLARREDEELAQAFGEAFLEYAARTPRFIPWFRGRRTRRARERLSELRIVPLASVAGREEKDEDPRTPGGADCRGPGSPA